MKKFMLPALFAALAMCVALPLITQGSIDADKMKEIIAKEIDAMQERKAQTKCPFSGHEVVAGKGYTYMGYMIATCCDDCAAAAEKDPLTAILKIRKAGEEPALAEGFSKVEKCPLSGQPLTEGKVKIKNNAMVAFCCDNCVAAYDKDPAKVTAKMAETKLAPTIITLEQTICPLMGHEMNGTSSVVYKGKQVNLCCDMCKAGFEANPDKVLQELADMGFVLADAK
jgi:YHS domain-containing protein